VRLPSENQASEVSDVSPISRSVSKGVGAALATAALGSGAGIAGLAATATPAGATWPNCYQGQRCYYNWNGCDIESITYSSTGGYIFAEIQVTSGPCTVATSMHLSSGGKGWWVSGDGNGSQHATAYFSPYNYTTDDPRRDFTQFAQANAKGSYCYTVYHGDGTGGSCSG
jgi:hypothetical protein